MDNYKKFELKIELASLNCKKKLAHNYHGICIGINYNYFSCLCSHAFINIHTDSTCKNHN